MDFIKKIAYDTFLTNYPYNISKTNQAKFYIHTKKELSNIVNTYMAYDYIKNH